MTRANTLSRAFTARTNVWLLLLLAAAWSGIGLRDTFAQTASKEYQVKAALLLNFVEFIQWPQSVFPDAQSPITIGVLGDDPFGSALEQTFQDESVEGRKVVIKRSKQLADLKTCHLLFICRSEKDRLGDILESLNDTSVVTVGDMDDFARRGGIINFYIDNNKIRFEINAAEPRGIKISSQLLKRARIVNADSRKG
jgi:hypothetical protein